MSETKKQIKQQIKQQIQTLVPKTIAKGDKTTKLAMAAMLQQAQLRSQKLSKLARKEVRREDRLVRDQSEQYKAFGAGVSTSVGIPGRAVHNTSAPMVRTGLQREFVAEINGTAAFTLANSRYLNIGNSSLFPRGSTWASLYTEFRFKKLAFEFDTTSYASNATGASAGSCIMVTNFDSAAPIFASYQEAVEYYGSADAVTYNNFVHVVQGKTKNTLGFDTEKNYFIYNSSNQALPTGNDNSIHDYNPGRFQFFTDNQAVTTAVGRLYVVYDVELLGPKLPLYSLPGPVAAMYRGSMTTGNCFNSMVVTTDNSHQLTVTFPTTNTISVVSTPALVNHALSLTISVNAATSVSSQMSVAVGANTTNLNLWTGETVTGVSLFKTPAAITIFTASTSTGTWNFTCVAAGAVEGACTVDVLVQVLPTILATATIETREELLEKRLVVMERMVKRFTIVDESDDDHLQDDHLPSPPTNTPQLVSARRN